MCLVMVIDIFLTSSAVATILILVWILLSVSVLNGLRMQSHKRKILKDHQLRRYIFQLGLIFLKHSIGTGCVLGLTGPVELVWWAE